MSAARGSTQTVEQLVMIWWSRRRAGILPACPLPEGYVLGTFRPDDAAEHLRLMRIAGFADWGEEKLAEAIEKCLPDGFLVIRQIQTDRLVAAAMAQRVPLDGCTDGGELNWVAADPEHRGKGLGYAVCAAATRCFIESGCWWVCLRTDDFRLAAIKVYLNLGYVPFLFAPEMEARWRDVCAKLGVEFEGMRSVLAPFTVSVHESGAVKDVFSHPDSGKVLGREGTLMDAAEEMCGGIAQLGTLRVNGACATLDTPVRPGATILIIPRVEDRR
jgi:mycothiol synthase